MNRNIIWMIISIIIVTIIINLFLVTSIGNKMLNEGYLVTSNIINSFHEKLSEHELNNKNMKELKVENEKIKKDNIKLKNTNEKLKSKNDLLSAANARNKIKLDNKKYKTVNATIIKRDLATWEYGATINVGSDEGIKEGQAIVSEGILIGVIDNVDKNFAHIKLMTSKNVKLNVLGEAISGKQEINGIVNKYKNKMYEFKTISSNDNLNKGDVIYTNGYQKLIPQGIEIGHVVDIQVDDIMGNTYMVSPSINSDDVRYVQVILNDN